MKHLAERNVEFLEPVIGDGALHLRAEEGRRHPQGAVSRGACRDLAEIHRLGLADGLGKQAQTRLLHLDLKLRLAIADEFVVDHDALPCVPRSLR